jgi:hypothetical protein
MILEQFYNIEQWSKFGVVFSMGKCKKIKKESLPFQMNLRLTLLEHFLKL